MLPAAAGGRPAGRLWTIMDSQRPHPVSQLGLSDVPTAPGLCLLPRRNSRLRRKSRHGYRTAFATPYAHGDGRRLVALLVSKERGRAPGGRPDERDASPATRAGRDRGGAGQCLDPHL